MSILFQLMQNDHKYHTLVESIDRLSSVGGGVQDKGGITVLAFKDVLDGDGNDEQLREGIGDEGGGGSSMRGILTRGNGIEGGGGREAMALLEMRDKRGASDGSLRIVKVERRCCTNFTQRSRMRSGSSLNVGEISLKGHWLRCANAVPVARGTAEELEERPVARMMRGKEIEHFA